MEEQRLHAPIDNGESTAIAAPIGLDDSTVVAYLCEHPEFLVRNPELAEVLTPPSASNDGSVVDLQRFMIERLREEVDSLRDCAQSLIDTSRDNLVHQSRTHSAAVALIDANSCADVARLLADEVAGILGLDAVTLSFEAVEPIRPDLTDSRIRRLPAGGVDRLIGENREVRLIAEAGDDGTIFGPAALRVHSCALIRLHMRDGEGYPLPPSVLAFGARDAGTFQPGQGTDLISFLARVIERCASKWPQKT